MRIRAALGIFVALSTFSVASDSHAQDRWYAGNSRPYGVGVGVPVGVGVGVGVPGAYGYGAYPGYSARTGMSDLVAAQGQRNVDNSQAAINYQQANLERTKVNAAMMDNRNKLMDDRLKRQQQAKEINEANREAEKVAEERRKKFEDEHRPQPLGSSQLDRTTGKISWPALLMSSDFETKRKAIDSSFQKLATQGPTDDLNTEIKMEINSLKDALRAQITTLPLPEYSESRKFLDRLANSGA